jgi:hypothetical protein
MPQNKQVDVKKLVRSSVPAGFKMRYKHDHHPKKGHYIGTYAWLENSNGDLVAQGRAVVSKSDTPIRALGRHIAHERAIKQFRQLHVGTTTGG